MFFKSKRSKEKPNKASWLFIEMLALEEQTSYCLLMKSSCSWKRSMPQKAVINAASAFPKPPTLLNCPYAPT